MLSEEKIINIINKFFDTAGTGNVPFYVAVKGLLDLYNKEKEKNNLLEQEREYLNCIIESDKDNYINKDKIKEKIEEYNKQRQETGNSIIYTRMVDYIDCLNELLGE